MFFFALTRSTVKKNMTQQGAVAAPEWPAEVALRSRAAGSSGREGGNLILFNWHRPEKIVRNSVDYLCIRPDHLKKHNKSDMD